MVKLLQLLVFILIQILLLPVTLLGLIPTIYTEMLISKRMGVSFTAGQVIQFHVLLHWFQKREDPISDKFLRQLPIESYWGIWATLSAMLIANRVCGYQPSFVQTTDPGTETLLTFPMVRVTQFDRIIKENIDKVEQLVLMGAGFDLRVLRLSKEKTVAVFELDQLKTQQMKLETIKKSGIANDWITYVGIDFREESWVQKLLEQGFDPSKKTLFHWESVSCYLEDQVVMDTLKKMVSISVPGGIISQDFYAKDFLSGERSSLIKILKKMVDLMGEPWIFGVDMSTDAEKTITSLLSDAGLSLTKVVFLGHRDKSGQPLYAITVSEIPDPLITHDSPG